MTESNVSIFPPEIERRLAMLNLAAQYRASSPEETIHLAEKFYSYVVNGVVPEAKPVTTADQAEC